MPHDRFSRGVVACALGLGLAAGAAAAQDQAVIADTLTSVMAAAMARMDHDMMAPATGDADRDFASMMIPHHQGAVEMAEAELRFGRDPVLRRLAQGIIVEQRQEIAVMRQAIATLPAMPAATPTPMHMHKDQ
jgi:uncharacterized protein (DUF305 family)